MHPPDQLLIAVGLAELEVRVLGAAERLDLGERRRAVNPALARAEAFRFGPFRT
jgi:hypothetical protein